MNRASETKGNLALFDTMESNVRTYCRDFPALFSHAQGSFLTDVEGKTYLDFFSGAGALNYGHNNPALQEPLINYIRSNGISHGLDFHTVAKRAFLESLQERVLKPRGFNYKVQFTGPTGANAVEAALKLARKVTGRTNVVAFTNAFHGMSLGALAATANPDKRAGAGIALNGVSFMPYEGYLGNDMDAFAVMERLLAQGGGVDKPAAILVETVQGEGGLRSASAHWLQRVQQLAKSLGALLIVDDIQAGCGRCGDFLSFEALGVVPDLVCLSKSLSGYGLPMSIALIRPDLDVWQPGEHNGTFRGNCLAFVTARAAIEQYWSEPTFAHSLHDKCRHLELKLQTLRQSLSRLHGLHVTTPGRGFMRGIDVGNGAHAAAASARAFKDGLLIETCGINGQVLKLLPALTIENDQLEHGLSILERAIATTGYPRMRQAA
jgi:diaminobutyrate-2-oxoglutarate transaminase